MMKKQVNLPIVIGLILVLTAVGFFGGMQYQKRSAGANFQRMGANDQAGNRAFGNGQQRVQTGNRMMQGGGRPVSGEIISSDATSITVKLDDGSSKIVMVSDSTQINKAEKVDKTSLTVGQKVAVFGSENNGTVTANNIQLNPMMPNSPQASGAATQK